METNTDSAKPVRQLVVIGLGLIGGSLAKAAKQRRLCRRVIGIARREEVCVQAVELGVVDHATTSLESIADSLGEGDVIFIAVPTLSIRKILEQVRACVPASVTITDGASVKGSVLRDVEAVYGEIPPQLVLGHPIAGSEKSGVEAANPDLYIKHRIILTPTIQTDPVHLQRVTQMWTAVEAEVLHLGVEDHDEILGATSHLPHAIAFSLVDTLAHDSKNENIFRYAAGGFRDFTRIASSDAVMWRDIMLANDQAVIKAIDLFSNNLNRLRTAIESKNSQELLGIFTRAKAARDHFSAMLAKRAYLSQVASSDLTLCVYPGAVLTGELRVPGDRSISHRAIMLAAIATGTTDIDGFLEGEDALATIQAFRDMEVVIEGPDDGHVRVHGVGLNGLQPPVGAIYVGGAGTAIRLLCGILAAQSFDSELIGDDALNQLSMTRVLAPLRQMGAEFSTAEGDRPPIQIRGGRELQGIDYVMPQASAQVKSSLLMAGLYARGNTRIQEPTRSRDHTERLLAGFTCPLAMQDGWLTLAQGGHLSGCQIDIPGDFSAAAVLLVAATLSAGSSLVLAHVGINPTRTGAISILQRMGAKMVIREQTVAGGEPVAHIDVEYAPLTATTVAADEVAVVMDELPILMVAASCAAGETRFCGVKALHLRSHLRTNSMMQALRTLGVAIDYREDVLSVVGGPLAGGTVDAAGDYRVALALLVAGLRAQSPVTVTSCASIATSFPNFLTLANRSGIRIEPIDH